MVERLEGVLAAGLFQAWLLLLIILLAPTRTVAQADETKGGDEVVAKDCKVIVPEQVVVTTEEERILFTEQAPPEEPFVMPEVEEIPEGPGVALGRALFDRYGDPALQKFYWPEEGNTPPFILNFAGLGFGFAGFTVPTKPPDTNAAVGDTQVVETVNKSYMVWKKSDGSKVGGPTLLTSLFLTPGPHSSPIGPRPPRQRLPPSLLIENASDPSSALPTCPARGVSDQG